MAPQQVGQERLESSKCFHSDLTVWVLQFSPSGRNPKRRALSGVHLVTKGGVPQHLLQQHGPRYSFTFRSNGGELRQLQDTAEVRCQAECAGRQREHTDALRSFKKELVTRATA